MFWDIYATSEVDLKSRMCMYWLSIKTCSTEKSQNCNNLIRLSYGDCDTSAIEELIKEGLNLWYPVIA